MFVSKKTNLNIRCKIVHNNHATYIIEGGSVNCLLLSWLFPITLASTVTNNAWYPAFSALLMSLTVKSLSFKTYIWSQSGMGESATACATSSSFVLEPTHAKQNGADAWAAPVGMRRIQDVRIQIYLQETRYDLCVSVFCGEMGSSVETGDPVYH